MVIRMRLTTMSCVWQKSKISCSRSSDIRELEINTSSTSCCLQTEAKIAIAAVNFQAVNQLSALRRIVVKKTDRRILERAIVQQFSQQQFTAVARSINQNSPAFGASALPESLAETNETPGDSRPET